MNYANALMLGRTQPLRPRQRDATLRLPAALESKGHFVITVRHDEMSRCSKKSFCRAKTNLWPARSPYDTVSPGRR